MRLSRKKRFFEIGPHVFILQPKIRHGVRIGPPSPNTANQKKVVCTFNKTRPSLWNLISLTRIRGHFEVLSCGFSVIHGQICGYWLFLAKVSIFGCNFRDILQRQPKITLGFMFTSPKSMEKLPLCSCLLLFYSYSNCVERALDRHIFIWKAKNGPSKS